MGISDSPFLPETFPRWESGFAESEFSYSESDIHSLYFGECEEIGNELSSIVYESDVSQEFATELGEQRAQFGSVIDVNGTQKIVKIRIFVSRDESYLQKTFD